MLSGLSNILGDGLVVFFAVLFILTEVATLPEKMHASLKNPEQSITHFQGFINKVIHYLGLKAATSALTAACVALLLWNIDYVFLWAVLAFFLNFIPYVGSVLAGLPPVLLGLIDHGILIALWAAAGYIAINVVVGNIIETRWMGEGLNLFRYTAAIPPKLSMKRKVLFVCVENSCRSQIAEAFGKMFGDNIIDAYSAGSRPSGIVNDKAIIAMNEVGYDLSGHVSKSLEDIPKVKYDYVITMGCGDECPYVLAEKREDWQIPDPKLMQMDQFKNIRSAIRDKVFQLIEKIKTVN